MANRASLARRLLRNRGLATMGSEAPQQKWRGVLSFGDGSQGALGQPDGYLCDLYEPAEVAGIPPDIARIGSGHYHSLAATTGGEVWAWGRNVEGQLGTGTKETWSHPKKVQGLEGVFVKEVVGSGVISMAIDSNGYIWTWGKSLRGQLGLGEKTIETTIPQCIKAFEGSKVVQVALGWGHAIACTTSGELYGWGYCPDGQLGFPAYSHQEQSDRVSTAASSKTKAEKMLELAEKMTLEDMEKENNPEIQWNPQIIDLHGLKAVGVSCGLDHSLVVCEPGLLLSFGDNTHGQLGAAVGQGVAQATQLVQGDLLNRHVVMASAGMNHSLAIVLESTAEPWHRTILQNGGTAYSWGWNSAFQLGREKGRIPAKIETLPEGKVLMLDGGRVHSIAVTSNCELWTWGSGKNGRLGLGSFVDEQQPCLVEGIRHLNVEQAVCGMDHTLLLVSDR